MKYFIFLILTLITSVAFGQSIETLEQQLKEAKELFEFLGGKRQQGKDDGGL